MPCPVTTGFLHSLEHNAEDKTRNTSFEFVTDSLGMFPEMRARAQGEQLREGDTYRRRAQFAIQTTVGWMGARAREFTAPLIAAAPLGPEEMMKHAIELREELGDLILVSRLKRKGGGANLHKLSDRLVVAGGLEALQKQLKGFMENDFKMVGYGLGDAFRAMNIPAEHSLKVARRLLQVNDG